MRIRTRHVAAALFVFVSATGAFAQTADDVINKSIAAAGGRAKLVTLKTRRLTGTITLMTPAGDMSGPVEILNAAPNKSRSLIKVDLTALGVGPLTLDQRFDGHTGYAIDSVQGNHEITGNQLDNLKNGSFPHPFLTLKAQGVAVKLVGKETVGNREVFVLSFEPPSGSAVREYIDAETYLTLKTVTTIFVPQLARDVEQTTEFSDYRDLDGFKLAFTVKASSAVQNYTIVFTKIEHNIPIDNALFVKPSTP